MSDLDDISVLGDAQGHTLFGHRRFNIKPEEELCSLLVAADGRFVPEDEPSRASTGVVEPKIRLHPLAASSLTAAAQYHSADSRQVLAINSAYRSLETQHRLFRNMLLKTRDFSRTIRRVAPPGWSEHHTGLAIDLNNPVETVSALLPYFGWEQSFPETGSSPIQHEPWHWRFVGAPAIRQVLTQRNGSDRHIAIGRQNLSKYNEIDFSREFLGLLPPKRTPRDPFLTMAEYLLELRRPLPRMDCTDYRGALFETATAALKTLEITGAESPQAVLLALAVLVPLLPRDRSERVLDFQKNLARLGLFQHAATRFYGPQTMEAVRRGRQLLEEPGPDMADISLLRTVRARAAMTLDTIPPSWLAEVLNGEWIGTAPDNLRLIRLVNASARQHIAEGSLVVARCATKGWDALDRCLSLIEEPISAALMIDGEDVPANPAVPILKVRRTHQAVIQLGRIARARANGKFVIVTGSSGKTTTKTVLRHLLSQQAIVRGTDGSANSLSAICYSLVNSINGADIFVMESGLGMAGSSIYQQSNLLKPDIAIVTAVHAAHAGGYASIEEIVHRKMDVAAGLKPDGYLLLDGDSDRLPLMRKLAEKHGVKNIVTFGEGEHCVARVMSYGTDGTRAMVTLSLFGEYHHVSFPMVGRHWAKMASIIMACGSLLDMDLTRMASDFETVSLPPGRGAMIGRLGKTLTVFDSHYNANPGSMKADLSAFGEIPQPAGSRKIAIIGSMDELGAMSKAYHLALEPDIAAVGFTRIYLVGKDAAVLEDALSVYASVTCHTRTESVIRSLKDELTGSECIFIKGSRSNELENVTRYLKRYMTEQQKSTH
jgi:UDP-N-acetylmuramoyl-tripeptide--D-alanyl-D-alanine ligase